MSKFWSEPVVNEAALDTALRRFPRLLGNARARRNEEYWRGMVQRIQAQIAAEYRYVLRKEQPVRRGRTLTPPPA